MEIFLSNRNRKLPEKTKVHVIFLRRTGICMPMEFRQFVSNTFRINKPSPVAIIIGTYTLQTQIIAHDSTKKARSAK